MISFCQSCVIRWIALASFALPPAVHQIQEQLVVAKKSVQSSLSPESGPTSSEPGHAVVVRGRLQGETRVGCGWRLGRSGRSVACEDLRRALVPVGFLICSPVRMLRGGVAVPALRHLPPPWRPLRLIRQSRMTRISKQCNRALETLTRRQLGIIRADLGPPRQLRKMAEFPLQDGRDTGDHLRQPVRFQRSTLEARGNQTNVGSHSLYPYRISSTSPCVVRTPGGRSSGCSRTRLYSCPPRTG